uniref:DUF4470 domain-containing protein n=1 Tax=Heterorhabditis bacteriophora TaxID=37862 RepID=A0A1I7XIC4_HETBA
MPQVPRISMMLIVLSAELPFFTVIQLARLSPTLLCTVFFLVTQELHNRLPGALDDICNPLHRVTVVVNAACMALQPDKLANMKNIAMSKKEFEKMEKLHYGWYVQAVSALLGAMGKAMYMKMNRLVLHPQIFLMCINLIISSYSHVIYSPQYDFVGKQKATEKSVKSKKQVHTKSKMKNNSRNINRKLSKIKNVPYRAKRNVLSLYTNKEAKMEAKRLDTEDSQFRPKNMASAPSLLSQHNSPVKLQQEVINHRKDTEFKYRMLDMVLGKDNPLRRPKSFSEKFRDIMPDTIDENVYQLMDSVSKRTKDVNYNFLSPRFFPLLPDKYKMGKSMFSPDLFPFYKDDNSILPIPEVLDEVGLNEKDKNSVLELIMDASGVNEVVDNTMGYLKKVKGTGLGEDLVSITNTIDRTFQDLEKSFDIRQKREMKSRKYSFLTKKQLEMLYGPQGKYSNEKY